MLFRIENFSPSTNVIYAYDKPNICPHCGIAINAATAIQHAGHLVYVAFFTCTVQDCKGAFFAVYKKKDGANALEYLYMYPEPYQPELSDLIRKLSPRCVELFNQAASAERLNHFDLAACGYRNAIEVLLKDFAIKYKSVKPDNMKRKSLSDCIKSYLDGLDETICSQIVKDFANNVTHYPPDDEDITYEDFKVYLDLLIYQIENMIRLRSVENRLPEKLQRKFGLPHQADDQPPDKE